MLQIIPISPPKFNLSSIKPFIFNRAKLEFPNLRLNGGINTDADKKIKMMLTGLIAKSSSNTLVRMHQAQMKNGMDTTTPRWSEPGENETLEQKNSRKSDNQGETPNSGEHETWEYYDSCYTRPKSRP